MTIKQTFFPRAAGPLPSRDIASPDESEGQASAVEVKDTLGGGQFPVAAPLPIQFDLRPLLIPATSQVDFNCEWNYDWFAVYFPSAPAATLTWGPSAAIMPMVVAGFAVLPFATTRQYRFNNSSATPYTVYIMYGRGIERPTITAI